MTANIKLNMDDAEVQNASVRAADANGTNAQEGPEISRRPISLQGSFRVTSCVLRSLKAAIFRTLSPARGRKCFGSSK